MKIAITGGIGSGKSFVCRELERHGIRVYDSDAAAKRLMRSDKPLQQSLCSLVGEEVYDAEGVLQKPVFCWQARPTSWLSTMWFILSWREISSRATSTGSRVPSSSKVDLSIALISTLWSVSRLQRRFAFSE